MACEVIKKGSQIILCMQKKDKWSFSSKSIRNILKIGDLISHFKMKNTNLQQHRPTNKHIMRTVKVYQIRYLL